MTRAQPGTVLGLFVLAGTVAAALTVQPRTGRLIFPVPALCYLLGALASGVVYDHSADKTEIAVGATQWIANGFFVMVLSTLLAIALTTVRWFLWRRDQRAPRPPGWSGPEPSRYGGGLDGRSDGRPEPRPRRAGPTATGPTATGPTATGPIGTGPIGTGPTATGPIGTGPTATGPIGSGPGTQPVKRQPGQTGPQGTGGRGPRPEPRPGSGPYNFSSGA